MIMCAGAHFLFAQQINMEPDLADTSVTVVGLKVHLPSFKEGDQISTFSGTYTVTLNTYLGNNWSLYAEMPFIVADTEFDTDNGLANIFVSFRKWINDEKTSALSAGLYIPTIGSDNLLRSSIGLYSNVARLPMFIESAWTVYGNYAYTNPADRAGIFSIYAGPDVVIPTNEGGDVEVLTHLGMKGGYKFDVFHAWGELNGIYILTEDALFNDSKLDGQLVLAGQFIINNVRPGLFYTIYFNDFITSVSPGVFGLKLDVGF